MTRVSLVSTALPQDAASDVGRIAARAALPNHVVAHCLVPALGRQNAAAPSLFGTEAQRVGERLS